MSISFHVFLVEISGPLFLKYETYEVMDREINHFIDFKIQWGEYLHPFCCNLIKSAEIEAIYSTPSSPDQKTLPNPYRCLKL